MSESIGARRAACLAGAALAVCVAFVAIRPGIAFASIAPSSTISGPRQLAVPDGERGGGQALPPTPQGGGLNAVQCWAERHCLAVGGSAKGVLVDRLSGTRWSIVAAPNPRGGSGTPTLNGLSCLGSRWCLAVGTNRCGGPAAERWNGRRWSLVNVDLPVCQFHAVGFTDVSCTSPSFCVALDSTDSYGDGYFVTWDGTAWLGHAQPQFYGLPIDFGAVSCAAPDACAEVGNGETDNWVGWWNGRDLGLHEIFDVGTRMGGPSIGRVSCPSVTFCIAVGGGTAEDGNEEGETVTWNRSHLGRISYPSPLTDPVAVSCVSRAACVAVNATAASNGNPSDGTSAATFNGSAWTRTASAFDAYPTAISCPVIGWCMVVGALLNPKTGNILTPAAASVN
jgi:hypothetical protein